MSRDREFPTAKNEGVGGQDDAEAFDEDLLAGKETACSTRKTKSVIEMPTRSKLKRKAAELVSKRQEAD